MVPAYRESFGNSYHCCYDIRYFLLCVSSHHQDGLIKYCSHGAIAIAFFSHN